MAGFFSFLNMPRGTAIVYCFIALMLIPATLFMLDFLGRLFRRFFPRMARVLKKLDVVLNVMIGDKANFAVDLGVPLIGFAKGSKLPDDHYVAIVYLQWFTLLAISSFVFARFLSRGFAKTFFIIMTMSLQLSVMAICSLHYIMPPYFPRISIIIAFMFVIFLVSWNWTAKYMIGLSGVVAAAGTSSSEVTNRTPHEVFLDLFVKEGLNMSLAAALAINASIYFWMDLEVHHRRTLSWISVCDFVVFWTMYAAKLLDRGVFYEVTVFFGLCMALALTIIAGLFKESVGYEFLILCFSFVTVALLSLDRFMARR